MRSRKDQKKKQRKKGKWWKFTLLVMLLIMLAAGAYVYSIYSNVKNTVDNDLHAPVSSIDTDLTKKKVKSKEPLNILLLGVDERNYDKGRSDTMIVMTLDPDNDRMQMISIPRDTRTEIVGKGIQDKINHAYAFGGSDMSVNTVENFLDIEIDYYVRMNMEGLEQLVDAVGGITVNNNLAFTNGSYEFPKGELNLNGKEALAFVRMRKQDPQGDAGRNERQRQVIEGVIDKGASLGGVNKIGEIMDILGTNVNTNMDFSDMRKLGTDYRSARKNTETYQIQGNGTRIDGVYYLNVPEEEVEKVNGMIEEYQS
ncbi:cell envelope-related function transcriptional attenuator common domain-containing protein [Thalassobacillus cyri]|uniref:Cell envelope-related function transcriptional attenuator common domain-containing protein n=1 Tax=Thalassobacillus cyri TaxID=571932 RepID=A0A1H4AP68_9BACI|nr:LCP family protein [Thalassobacillus cyri]SEA37730.1 cell envelope-related function transcriptional attenuator common domain-containing protein [Thalassobacillus cyri]